MKNLAKFKEKIVITIILLVTVCIASLPAFRDGIYNGFDLWFHMGRIESIASELANGQFPVRYESASWYGNGYISSTMYGNTLLYFPAILHILGFETYKCYNYYVVFINILGVIISMYSFSHLFKDKRYGLTATIAYMLAGYYVSNIYMRAAVGEYTATIFLPLIVYGLYRILYEDRYCNTIEKVLPLIIGVSGIIQAHILTTYMIAMSIFVYLMIFFKDSVKHIKELVVALISIVCVNVFFLLPFLDSYLSYSFRANQSLVGVNIQKYGLYFDQILGLFPEGSGGRAEWSSKGEESSRIGILVVALLLTFVIYFVINIKSKHEALKSDEKRVLGVFGIGCLAAWMSSAYFPWGIFSGDNAFSNVMRGVQYPSRYLLIQTLSWIICGVYALKKIVGTASELKQRKNYMLVLGIGFILALAQNGIFMYTLSCRNLTVQSIEGHESIADDLYLFAGIDMENIETEARLIDGDNCIVKDLGYLGDNRQILIDNKSDSEASVLVPIFCYKYIFAKDSNGTEYKLTPTDSYQYKVTVGSGFSDTMIIHFKEPMLWRVAECVSLVSIIILILLYVRGTKSKYHE